MVGNGMFNGLNSFINFVIIVIIVLLIISLYAIYDWIFIEAVIKTTERLVPELEITVKNNVIDTLYVYRKP